MWVLFCNTNKCSVLRTFVNPGEFNKTSNFWSKKISLFQKTEIFLVKNLKTHLSESFPWQAFRVPLKNCILLRRSFAKLWKISESIKNAFIFFRKLTITGPFGCRQVNCSIRLARLSFLETNSSIGFLPLTPCYIQTFQWTKQI